MAKLQEKVVKHWFIASIIITLGLMIVLIIYSGFNEHNGKEYVQIKAEAWNNFDTSGDSTGRYGYSALYETVLKKWNAEIYPHPSYPDEKFGFSNKKNLLIINAPTRSWNDNDVQGLLEYLKRGGEVLLVTPSQYHLQNTSLFIKELGIEALLEESNEYEAENVWSAKNIAVRKTQKYNSLLYDDEINIPYFENFSIKLDNKIDLKFLKSGKFTVLLETNKQRPVLSLLEKKEWKGGRLYWMTAVFPGYNGAYKDLQYYDNFWSILKEANGKPVDRIKSSLNDVMTTGKKNNSEKIIAEGKNNLKEQFDFIDAFFSYATDNNIKVYFYDYLASGAGATPMVALFETGAGWTIIIIIVLIFSGLLFFIRDNIPIEMFKEIKQSSKHIKLDSQIDPDIVLESNARFKAQFIEINNKLHKLPRSK